MKRSTIVLVALFAAALAYWFLAVRGAKAPGEAAAEAKKLFKLDPKQIASLRITRPDGTVALERGDRDQWTITEPVRARAERMLAASAAAAIAGLTQERTLGPQSDPKTLGEMGFSPPRARVEYKTAPPGKTGQDTKNAEAGPDTKVTKLTKVTKDAKNDQNGPLDPNNPIGKADGGPVETATIEFGGDVPASNSAFVRIAGRDEVFVVPASFAEPFTKPVADYRDHALLDMTILDVGEARIARPEGDVRFKRRGDAWWVEAPYEDLAEGSTVQTLLSALIGLRAESFLDVSDPALAAAPVTVTLLSGAGASLATLRISAMSPSEPGKRRVRAEIPPGDPVDVVASFGEGADLAKSASEFRARKAIPFHSWNATRLKLTSRSVTLDFVKKDGLWSAAAPAGLKVDSGAVDETIRDLADLDVVSYDAGKGAAARALGLSPPAATIEVRLEGEADEVKTLTVGAASAGPGGVYASASGRPGVLIVPASILARIEGGAALYSEKPTIPVPDANAPHAPTGPAPSSATAGTKAPSPPPAPAAPPR